MSDLAAYVDFSVIADLSGATPEIRLIDTSIYPAGVINGITGIITVTQPDGVTVTGAFTPTADTYYNGSVISIGHKELRLATDGQLQRGLYTITYTVRHAGYSDTAVTQTFSISYKRPVQAIVPAFDVYTPLIRVNDGTSYYLSDYTLQATTRSWSAVIAGVGTVTGTNAPQFDMAYNGNYYDSIYTPTLTATNTYTSGNLTIIDKLSTSAVYSTIVPDSLNFLFTQLIALKTLYDVQSCKSEEQKDKYMYAAILFEDYKMRGNCGITASLLATYHELKQALSPTDQEATYVPSHSIIPHYSFTDFCGCCGGTGSGGGSGSDVVLEIRTGFGSGYTVSDVDPGDKRKITIPALIGKSIKGFFVQGQRILMKITQDGTMYGTFDPVTGTITAYNGSFPYDTAIQVNYNTVGGEDTGSGSNINVGEAIIPSSS